MKRETRREKIIKILSETEEPLTVDELAFYLHEEDRRSIIEDLEHVAKTVKKNGMVLLMEPARCNKCGYVFRTARVKPPSRCPRCKSEWISPPRFIIRED